MTGVRRSTGILLAAVAALSGLAAEPIGWIDPPSRPEGWPSGPLAVMGSTDIASVNANTSNGRSVLEFTQVRISGIAQTGIGQLDPRDTANPALWFYVSDGTGTVAISKGTGGAGLPAVAAGDSVSVDTFVFTQSTTPLKGTRTLDMDAVGVGTITRHNGGHALDAPQPTLPSQIVTNGNGIEGTLVSVDGLSVVSAAEWPTSGNSGFVRVTDGTDQFRIFIDNDTDLDGIVAPSGTFSVTGFVAQNYLGAGTNWLVDHFVYPRSSADIVQGDGDGTCVVTPQFVTEGIAGRTLTFDVAGVQATLTSMELDVPASWTWNAPRTVTLSGAGFSGTTPVVNAAGGGWTIVVDGTALSAADTGTLVIESIDAPATPEDSEFTTRTSAGGTLQPIGVSPVVHVVSAAQPGDVVINEILPTGRKLIDLEEGSEFIELYNPGAQPIVLSGWTLSDAGRTGDCALDARWAFPTGTTIDAGGFVVVCRSAILNPNSPSGRKGFLVEFDDFPSDSVQLFEMYDADAPDSATDENDPATPDMVLLDASSEDDQITLLGGYKTNSGQCASDLLPVGVLAPFAEAVVLRNSLGEAIDAVRYREVGPCDGDFCGSGAFGDAAPYPFGAPSWLSSLGRDAVGTDTDDSSADLRPATIATPGRTNVPGDTSPPRLEAEGSGARSNTVFVVEFDEVVDDATATDPASYVITPAGGFAPVAVREVIADALSRFRRYVIVSDPLPGNATGTLTAPGVTDLAFDGGTPNASTAALAFTVPTDALPICEVQSFDDRGFSPYDGEEVTVAGYVTIEPAAADRISIWVQEPGEGGCGVNVFSFDYPADALSYGVRLNDVVQIHGRVTEFVSSSSGSGAVTELSAVEGQTFYTLMARGATGPEPREVSTRDANDERLEGTLVRTRGTVINANSLAAYIDDGSGSIQVFQNFSALDLTRFTVGDRLEVTGVITQFDSTDPFFSGYELVPQNQDALVPLDGGFSTGGPLVAVEKGVLVPELGEAMRITVTTPRRSDVVVEIYDVTGRKVHTLYDGVGLGVMEFDWEGLGQDGARVPPGAYMCHVRAVALDGGSVVTKTVPVVVGMRLE